ncbi:helix-turn-helix domain-containing protein [Gordonia sp. AC31]|uniref:helix-turn-helix domain-containing protein n=1 Tax=Gordonia sp. AC31 TaxID=2962571 RepID=UPI002882B8C4|nr:helix-turn-helix domain-containing protein [Gordonia sp. AC31]MDT0223485.1 helix-turn-helix domain-containing protein [Gordonia sp. AC31]
MGDGGFVRLPYELIDSGRLTNSEMCVYISLLRHRDHHTGRCWPSYATIAQEARVTRRTAISVIKRLEEVGIIRIFAEHNKPNVYEVALFDGFPTDPEGGETIAPGSEMVSPRSEMISPEGCNGFTSGGEKEHHEQEPLNKNQELAPSNEKHERALRSDDTSDEHNFSFDTEPEKPISPKQFTYMTDLYIHIMGSTPPAAQAAQWREFTQAQADAHIKAWNQRVPRGDEYAGPEYGEDAYNRLSANGQDAADRGLIPDWRSA